jgi:hypothetical protein
VRSSECRFVGVSFPFSLWKFLKFRLNILVSTVRRSSDSVTPLGLLPVGFHAHTRKKLASHRRRRLWRRRRPISTGTGPVRRRKPAPPPHLLSRLAHTLTVRLIPVSRAHERRRRRRRRCRLFSGATAQSR